MTNVHLQYNKRKPKLLTVKLVQDGSELDLEKLRLDKLSHTEDKKSTSNYESKPKTKQD